MKHHPRYAPIYTAYAAVYFDRKQYNPAIKVLEQGVKATDGKNGELHYFLGLAYFNAGRIHKAREHEKLARENNYPFRALTRKLAEHDAKTAHPKRHAQAKAKRQAQAKAKRQAEAKARAQRQAKTAQQQSGQ